MASALVRLAHGLATAYETNDAALARAQLEFDAVAGTTIAAYPFPRQWRHAIRREQAIARDGRQYLHPLAIAWIGKLEGSTQERPGSVRPQFDDAWKERADRIERGLKVDPLAWESEAEALVAEERSHAEATGNSDPLMRSLVRFAQTIAEADPTRGEAWCDEARRWEPWNPYGWTVGTRCSLASGNRAKALELGFAALRAFPENPFAYVALCSALIRTRNHLEWEEVSRSAHERFPDDPRFVDGLISALLLQKKLAAAQREFNRFVELFGKGPLARDIAKRIEGRQQQPASGAEALRPAPTMIQARLQRRAARRLRVAGEDGASLEGLAAHTIGALLTQDPGSADAIAEHTLLLLDRSQVTEAREWLDANSSLRAHAGLLSASARALRVDAVVADAAYSTAAFADLRAPADELDELNPTGLHVLAELHRTRAVVALTDGHIRDTALREQGRSLVMALSDPGPATWWASRVHAAVGDPEDVRLFERRIEERSFLLDGLEEDLSGRATANLLAV